MQPVPSTALIILLVGVLPIAIGIVMITLSRPRGKRHPSCGRCGYDVTGSVGRTETCPECGRSFLEVGVIPPRRIGRPGLLIFGLIFVIVSVLVMGTGLTLSSVTAARAQEERARAMAAMNQALLAQQQTQQQVLQAEKETEN